MRHLVCAVAIATFGLTGCTHSGSHSGGAGSAVFAQAISQAGNQADNVTVFDQTVTRNHGKPGPVDLSFSVPVTTLVYHLNLQCDRISSATVNLNGTTIFGPSDFNETVTMLQATVPVQLTNTLQIDVKGKPGSSIHATVTVHDTVAPTVTVP